MMNVQSPFTQAVMEYFPRIFSPLRPPQGLEPIVRGDANEIATSVAKKDSVGVVHRIVDGFQTIYGTLRDTFIEAHTHEHTGLPNRRLFQKTATEELSRINDGRSQGMAILMLDVDKLKAVNTAFGFDGGDQLLTAVANKIDHIITDNDITAHIGGDEFSVLITDETPERIQAIHEQLRDSLERFSVDINNVPIQTGVSIGLAHAYPGDTYEGIFKRADEALQEQKKARQDEREARAAQIDPDYSP